MKTSHRLAITIVVLSLMDIFTAKCQPNTTIDDYDCSEATYDPNSGYAAEVDAGLDELAYMTIDDPNLQQVLTGRYAMGYAYCQLRLRANPDDCITCLETAADFLRSDCQFSVSAVVAMIDCGMRYDPISQTTTGEHMGNYTHAMGYE